jgi:hypothetical protein
MPDTQPETKPEPKSRNRVWEALTNLSISRGEDKDKSADIVHRGETVTLTDEQAHGFLHRHRRPVIRPAADQNEADPNLKAKDLFGQRPPAEAFGARPDPPGSSKVTVNDEVADPADPRNAPEAKDPKTDFSVDPAAAKDKGTGVKK